MPTRTLLAGIAGGVIVFIWSAFSHMVLPLGEMGLKSLDTDSALLDAFPAHVAADGLYYFPGMNPALSGSDAQRDWAERHRRGPSGLLLIRLGGAEPSMTRPILIELLTNVMAGVFVAALIGWVGLSTLGGALFAASLAVLGWLNISVSYWAWYRFPSAFILSDGVDQVVGWFLAGLAMAALVGRRAQRRW